MQDSQRVPKVAGVVIDIHVRKVGVLELDVGVINQRRPGDLKGSSTGINAVQNANPRCKEPGLPTRAAPRVKANSTFGQIRPREDRGVVVEHLGKFVVTQRLVGKASPFVAKRIDHGWVHVRHR